MRASGDRGCGRPRVACGTREVGHAVGGEREKKKEKKREKGKRGKRNGKREKEIEKKKIKMGGRKKKKGGGRCAPAATAAAVGHAWRAGRGRWGTGSEGREEKGEREKEGAIFAATGRNASRWMGKDGT